MSRHVFLAASAVFVSSTALAGAAEPLVDSAWLAQRLERQDVVVLDIRDAEDGSSAALFAEGHVPGSIHSDYAKGGWRTTSGRIVGMLPPVAEVEALIGRLGIDNDDHVVIVGHGKTSSDFGASTRVFWTFDVMGHENVSILEGGHAGWVAAGGPVETGAGQTPEPAIFKADFRPDLVASLDDVKVALDTGIPLVDARPEGQYTGEVTPPNVGIAGTIPGAYSLPHDVVVLDGNDAIEEPQLDALLAKLDLQPSGEKIAFCNTGHWASIGWFLLNKVGNDPSVRMYDGSMYEWAKVEGEQTEIGADRTVN
ncbi:MAG TPA: sulfurtransferase [Geminicoccus sp.]|jgi:thiosulfate/3-mercaptopyruvate sulfurtransferase|uniref:sulfurtransferase n=1 Tax=Geminicoccus sp. TaxID=2024832 RepID=UPI002E37A754|nr:sulfurtransferase [Geminicoccus sp.]HEX2527403.1 sulfurtransferase [Geminicoccus sp.]